jgi:chromosome segregation ATPase
MSRLGLVDLVASVIVENQQAITALKEFEAAKEKAFASGDSVGLQRELEKLAQTTQTVNRNFDPLARSSKVVSAEMRELSTAVKAGLVPVTEGSKRFRELEASLKQQLGTLQKGSSEYRAISAHMKDAGEQARRLEAVVKTANAAFKSDDLARYRQGLNDVITAEKAGIVSRDQAVAQLRSYQSALAQQTGALEKNGAEHRAVVKVMGETGAAIKKLEADADKLDASFRSDALSRYAGEFRQIDAAGKTGTSGFAEAEARVDRLTVELRDQQDQLGTTGREFDQFSRLLQSAAAQQERYQRAAEQAQRANDASQVRTYGSELKQLEGQLKSATQELGRLDAQQRAIRYDSAGVAAYRRETEGLEGSFATIGRGLGELETRLQTYARGLSQGSREHAELTRVLQATERATQSLTAQQERAGAAYRSVDLSQFVARLREIETAQKSNLITSEQAARAVQQVEGEFREYAAALGVTGRELGVYVTRQREAGQSADQFAGAQERAQRAFDAAALRQFTGELNEAVRAYREGETSTERYGQAVTSVQGRLREYASTLDQSGREFAELNKLLELSERALVGVGTAAERSAEGFDPSAIERYGRELSTLERAQRDLVSSIDALERAQRASQDAFAKTQLDKFRGELDALSRALRDGSSDFDVLARTAEQTQRELTDYLGTLNKTGAEHVELSRALETSGRALQALGTEAQRAGQGFDPQPVERFRTELEGLEGTGRELGQNFDQIQSELAQLDASLRDSGSSAQLSAREQQALGTVMRELEGTTTRLAAAQDKAQAAFKSDTLRTFRTDLEQILTAQKNGVITFEQAGRAVEALQGRMREFGISTQLTKSEQLELAKAMQGTETATTQLGAAADKLKAAFAAEQIRGFKSELDAITASQRAGLSTFDEAARKVTELQGRMREYGSSLDGSVTAQKALDAALKSTEGALDRFSAGAERAQKAFHAEEIKRYNTELLELKRALDTGETSLDGFNASVERMQTSLRDAAAQTERGTTAQLAYARALDRTDSAHAQANGRVRTFGLAMGVSAGIGDQLQNVLYSMGPAGEAAGVAFSAAGAGATGAAGGVRLLQISLAAGLVGALVAAAVGAVALTRSMFSIDTGLTDVGKTTGFTRDELNQLAGELQEVALATGTPLQGLLDLASVAGSLGITGVENVASFVDTINKLAVATDIVGAEGAEQLAKFINVTKEMGQSVGESAELVGNVIVRLGNELAATEAPILAMAGRIGGLATTAKLSQTDILALAGTYVSLGFTAEGAGTSLQSLVNKVYQAGQVGGPALTSFAKGANMTEEAFQALAKTDAAAAFEAYIKGLNDSQKAGENIVPVIKEITGNNETMLGVITRGVGGFETLSLSMTAARDEAERLTAMNNELQTRLDSLQGIVSLIGQAFAFMGDSIALRLIPVLKTGLLGVLDFTRGIMGLEQTGDRVDSFATTSAASILEFGRAMNTGSSESTTFAAVLGVNFNKAGDVLNTLNERFSGAGESTRQAILGMLGLVDASKPLVPTLSSVQAGAEAAARGIDVLKAATDKQGLTSAVTVMASTLTGPAKSAFIELARQAIASGKDITAIAGVIEQGYNESRASILETERVAANTRLAEARVKLQQVYTAAHQRELLEANQRIASGRELLAEMELRRARGEQVSQEEIDGIKRVIVEQQERRDRESIHFQEFSGDIMEATAGVNAAEDAANELTREIEALSETEGPTAVAEGMEATVVGAENATAAVEAFDRVLAVSTQVQNMTEEQARAYKDELLALRDTYPQLTGQINPLIAAVNEKITSFKDSTEATEEEAAASETAAEAARLLEERQKAVADATVLLGRGAGASSQELFAMAMSLADAAKGTDETALAAQRLQTELVLSAAAMDAQARATEEAIAAGENFQARLDSVSTAQDLLARGSAATSDELFAMAASLGDAANGTDAFAQNAQRLQQELIAAAVAIDAEAAALERAVAAGEEFQAKLDTVAEAQNLLAQGSGASSDALFQMAISLADAASGTGAFADNARALQTELVLQAAALEESERAAAALAEAQDVISQGTDALNKGLSLSSDELFGLAQELSVVAQGETEVADEAAALAQELINNAVAVDRNARAMEEAAAAAEKYATNQATVAEAQDLLREGSTASADELRTMADNLDLAAEGSGRLGEQARNLQEALRTQADELDRSALAAEQGEEAMKALQDVLDDMDTSAGKSAGDFAVMREAIYQAGGAAEITVERMKELIAQVDALEQRAREGQALQGYGVILGQIGELLASGASDSTESGFATAISAIGAAAVEAGGLMDEFAGNLGSQLGAAGQVFGVFADVVRQTFGEDIPSEIEIGLSAIETGIQGAAAGFAIGGPIGAAIGGGLGLILGFFTASSEAANQAAAEEKARQEEAAKAHAEYIEKWKERERERVEAIREGQRDLDRIYSEMRQSSQDFTQSLNEARLDNARASGAEESVIFISETILAIRSASAEFHQEMARITQDKNEFITAYLAANPGATRGEAEQRAEALFGPERDAYRESFALTTSTLLLEGEEQAKELGLSQREYYDAVFAGNTELLGTMTEGQRLAIIEFVRIAEEMGIELPKAITDAAARYDEAAGAAGAQNVEASRAANQQRIDGLVAEKEEYKAAWETREAELIELIANSSGETRAAYIGMLAEEREAYTTGLRERNEAINAANEESANSDVAGIEKRREALKSAYEADKAKLMEGFADATITERLAILQRVEDLTDAYETSDAELVSLISENEDGVGSAIAESAQLTVDGIEEEIRVTNEAWARRSQELDTLIRNSSGVTKQAYIDMKAEEGAAYQDAISGLMGDLQAANQALLDAQDKSADDFVAAQEEVGRKEQEALNGVFAILREVLGEDAQIIIDMIQRTYNSRREAYLAEGQATAEAAEQANQGELEKLDSIFAMLRELLGPDAQIIIDMINRSYEGRRQAYDSGGTAAAESAEASAQAERTSIANINQVLRDLFGPEAEGIIAQILALYEKRARAHREGGGAAAAGAEEGAGSERAAIANINQLLRDIFGPEAQGIIDQILALYNKRADAHRAGGEANAQASTEGSNAEADAINSGTENVGGALSERERTLVGFLERTDISPEVRRQAEALRMAFVEGDGMTAAQVAEGRERVAAALEERDRRITELVGQGKTQAEAARIADGELARTLAEIGKDVGAGAVEGGEAAAGGITQSKDAQIAAINGYLGDFNGAIQGIPNSALPVINGAFQSITGGFGSGTSLFAQGVSSSWGGLNSTFSSLGGSFATTVSSVFGNLTKNIGDGYRLTAQAQSSGSSEQVAQIKRAYDAENREFTTRSAELLRQIASAKGDEKAKLMDEYRALQAEHEAKSRDYQKAIDEAAKYESGAIKQGSILVSGGLGDMGDDVVDAARKAYEAERAKHEAESRLYQNLMGTEANKEKAAAIAAAVTTGGGLSSMADKVNTATGTAFTNMGNKFETEVGGFIRKIDGQKDDLKAALDAIAKIIKDFDYPALPPPPAVPRAAVNAAFGGLPGGDLTSTSVDLPSTLGAYAADSLPDYSGATSQTRAYAAATSSLFDLFDGSKRSLSFTATQERALNLNVSFTGFTAALSEPIGLLDRAANLFWESVRYQRETALIDRETAELWRENVRGRASRPGVKLQRKRR